MCGITKKGHGSSVKGHTCEFLPLIFFKFKVFGMLHPPKQHVVLKTIAPAKAFCVVNNWPKQTLEIKR